MRTPGAPRRARSLAPATGRRIGYPTPVPREQRPEADLRDPSPVSEVPDVAPPAGDGTLLAVLVHRDGAGEAARRHSIRRTAVTIGRGEDNDVVIDQPSISEHHARLDLAEGVWTVTDLGSVNGTVVDGESAAAAVPIATGSALRFGGVDLVFLPHDRWDDSAPAEPALLDTARIARALGPEFTLGVPERRGFPVPLVVGFVITVLAMFGYLLSRGG